MKQYTEYPGIWREFMRERQGIWREEATAPTPTLAEVLKARGGVLSHGGNCEGACCALEALALVRLGVATDDPVELGVPDIRRLNDMEWSSDAARTAHLLPVVEALLDYHRWPLDRRQRFATELVVQVVKEFLSPALARVGLTEEARACLEASDPYQASDAAVAANKAAERASFVYGSTPYGFACAEAAAAANDVYRAARDIHKAACYIHTAEDTCRAARIQMAEDSYRAACDYYNSATGSVGILVSALWNIAGSLKLEPETPDVDNFLGRACKMFVEAAKGSEHDKG